MPVGRWINALVNGRMVAVEGQYDEDGQGYNLNNGTATFQNLPLILNR